MKFKLYCPFKNLNVIFALFDTQYDLCSTMIRIQEYYESDSNKFRGNIFDLDSYMDYYAKKHGNFTYFSDWNGFNIPCDVYDKWCDLMDEHDFEWRNKELEFADSIDMKTLDMDKWYLIACHKGTGNAPQFNTFKHEVSHAMFYLDETYRNASIDILEHEIDISIRREMKIFLAERGYGHNVFTDESIAYIATSDIEKLAPKINMVSKYISDQCLLLSDLYDHHFENAGIKSSIRSKFDI